MSKKDLIEVAKAALEYIDAIPKDIELPSMPGFSRDWADAVIEKAEKEMEDIESNMDETDKFFEDLEKTENEILLKHLVERMNNIFNDQKTGWKFKYNVIFSESISKRINALVHIDYCDPDTSYEEDVTAFVNAVNSYMKN
jgi:uncharacterized FlaG/YvyC family protein